MARGSVRAAVTVLALLVAFCWPGVAYQIDEKYASAWTDAGEQQPFSRWISGGDKELAGSSVSEGVRFTDLDSSEDEFKFSEPPTYDLNDPTLGSEILQLLQESESTDEKEKEEEKSEEGAGLVCALAGSSPPVESAGNLRLVDGAQSRGARLEIFHDGVWGTVCDRFNRFDRNSATIACKELGYHGGEPVRDFGTTVPYNPYARLAIMLDKVACRGTEQRIDECTNRGWGTHSCTHAQDVGVCCRATRTGPCMSSFENGVGEGALRITMGTPQRGGRLEVYHSNSWGTVCANAFSLTNARVACRQLGLQWGPDDRVSYFTFGEQAPSQGIQMDNVQCRGREEKFKDCPFRGWGQTPGCTHNNDQGVCCFNCPGGGNCSGHGTCTRGVCACVEGFQGADCSGHFCPRNCNGPSHGHCDSRTGRCVCVEGWAGSDCGSRACPGCSGHGHCNSQGHCVCSPGFRGRRCERECPNRDENCSGHGTCDSDGVCQCTAGWTAPDCSLKTCPGEKQVPSRIWLDDLRCRGIETSVSRCSHRTWGHHNCNHNEDVGVCCRNLEGDVAVWLLSRAGQVYRRDGISWGRPKGTSWSGDLGHPNTIVSIGAGDPQNVAMASDKKVYYRRVFNGNNDLTGNGWKQRSTQLYHRSRSYIAGWGWAHWVDLLQLEAVVTNPQNKTVSAEGYSGPKAVGTHGGYLPVPPGDHVEYPTETTHGYLDDTTKTTVFNNFHSLPYKVLKNLSQEKLEKYDLLDHIEAYEQRAWAQQASEGWAADSSNDHENDGWAGNPRHNQSEPGVKDSFLELESHVRSKVHSRHRHTAHHLAHVKNHDGSAHEMHHHGADEDNAPSNAAVESSAKSKWWWSRHGGCPSNCYNWVGHGWCQRWHNWWSGHHSQCRCNGRYYGSDCRCARCVSNCRGHGSCHCNGICSCWGGYQGHSCQVPPWPILMDDVRCRGNEAKLAHCRHRGWYSHNCGHHEDVGICCRETAHDECADHVQGWDNRYHRLNNLSIRLTTNRRLEIRYGSTWGTVCDDGFGSREAQVVCRELNLPHAAAYAYTSGGTGLRVASYDRRVLNHISIAMSNTAAWATHKNTIPRDYGASYLSNPNSNSWHSIGGSWKYVSVGQWPDVWLIATNNQIYRRGGISWHRKGGSHNIHIPGSLKYVSVGKDRYSVWGVNRWGSIWLRVGVMPHNQNGYHWQLSDGCAWHIDIGDWFNVWVVGCDGNIYRRMGQTSINPKGTHWVFMGRPSGAHQIKRIAVGMKSKQTSCASHARWHHMPTKGSLKVSHGSSGTGGRLWVYNNGRWGSVCNDHVGANEGHTICRQLGYVVGSAYTHGARDGYTKIPCSHHGLCGVDGKCYCDTRWRTFDCHAKRCPHDCTGHGDCTDDGRCICKPGWKGTACDTRLCPNDCSGHGKCIQGECHCDVGWISDDCSKRFVPQLLDEARGLPAPARFAPPESGGSFDSVQGVDVCERIETGVLKGVPHSAHFSKEDGIFTMAVNFTTELHGVPIVRVTVNSFDMGAGDNQRIDTFAKDVTGTGFNLVVQTWGDTQLEDLSVQFEAFGLDKKCMEILHGTFDRINKGIRIIHSEQEAFNRTIIKTFMSYKRHVAKMKPSLEKLSAEDKTTEHQMAVSQDHMKLVKHVIKVNVAATDRLVGAYQGEMKQMKQRADGNENTMDDVKRSMPLGGSNRLPEFEELTAYQVNATTSFSRIRADLTELWDRNKKMKAHIDLLRLKAAARKQVSRLAGQRILADKEAAGGFDELLQTGENTEKPTANAGEGRRVARLCRCGHVGKDGETPKLKCACLRDGEVELK